MAQRWGIKVEPINFISWIHYIHLKFKTDNFLSLYVQDVGRVHATSLYPDFVDQVYFSRGEG